MFQSLPESRHGDVSIVEFDADLANNIRVLQIDADGSLILADAHYLQFGSITLQPESDLSISFWFIGMPHPSGEQRHVLPESSTPDAASFIRFKQNSRHPGGITVIVMIESTSALEATNQPTLGNHITSKSGAAVSVGQWNHGLLVINTGER